MICQLVVKCAMLIAVVQALRLVGRRAGPRASGLILGLPSTTAVLLILCGHEEGIPAAVEMADAGLVGLIAAVALPLAYAQAARRGWSLHAALAAAIAGYAVVASALGLVHPSGVFERMAASFACILAAAHLASRIGPPPSDPPRAAPPGRRVAIVRTIVPVSYIIMVGVVTGLASPRWAGLVGTFPGLSTVVLAVTHLEEGAASAGRIARALPPANLSTAAFLAAFRLGCPALGLAWGMSCGYLAALLGLAAIGGIPRSIRLPVQALRSPGRPNPSVGRARLSWGLIRRDLAMPASASPCRHGRFRPPHRRSFAPRMEILAC